MKCVLTSVSLLMIALNVSSTKGWLNRRYLSEFGLNINGQRNVKVFLSLITNAPIAMIGTEFNNNKRRENTHNV